MAGIQGPYVRWAPSIESDRSGPHNSREKLHPHRPSMVQSDPEKKDAELGPTISIRIQHVKGLRVPAPHHPLEPGSHVHHLPLSTSAAALLRRDHARANRHGLHGPQHVQVRLSARATDRVPALPPVTVHGPHGLVEEPHPAT